MTKEERQEMFLARALEAMQQASKAATAVARVQWMQIAEAYRQLAENR